MKLSNTGPTFWNYAAGVGAGTVLTTYAQSVGENIPLKNWLIFITPAFTIATTLFINWVVKEIGEWYKERKAQSAINKLETDLSNALVNNELLSDAEKERIRKQLVKLKIYDLEKRLSLIENLYKS